jgi:flagellin
VAIKLGSNIPSLRAQRELNKGTAALSKAYERLSSGLRINSPSDDAAGLALASSLVMDSHILKQAIRNVNDGISLLNIADAATTELTSIVQRIRELAEQASNGTYSSEQRQALNTEAQALADEYQRIASTTKFNGMALFDGSLQAVSMQAGSGDSAIITGSLGGILGTGAVSSSGSYTTELLASRAAPVLGDLNGDGILDMVTAGETDSADGYATVRLGTGGGSFGAATSYTTESQASYAIQLEDLNNDGILDLVTAGTTDSFVGSATIRLGRGDGTFGASTSYTTESTSSYGLTLGDINGDGYIDMITGGQTSAVTGAATVRLGNGNGTFGASTSYATQAVRTFSVALGDLNGDGFADMVTTGLNTGLIDGRTMIRLGNGNGTFQAGTSYISEDGGSYSVTLGDLNNDGILDLVTGGINSSNQGISTIRLGVGDGTFGASTSISTNGFRTNSVTLSDINGDGNVDLISAGISGSSTGELQIRLGNGNGTFASASTYNAESYYSSGVTTGDINADGAIDIVTAGASPTDGYATTFLATTRNGVAPIQPFSLLTMADARWANSLMEQKLDQLTLQVSTIGAFQSRLVVATNTLRSTEFNTRAAADKILDADIAFESAEMVRLSILQQAAAAILAQANQGGQIALSILNSAL